MTAVALAMVLGMATGAGAQPTNDCTWDGIPRDNPADGIVCRPRANREERERQAIIRDTPGSLPTNDCRWDGIPRDNPADGVVCRPRAVAPSALPTPQAPLAVAPDGTIRYTPGRPIIATVTLNGRTTARLVLDTGADFSMVTPGLLAAAGVDLSRPVAFGEAAGVGSRMQVSYYRVTFEVAGHRAVLEAMSYPATDFDGLLGRDFLDRFKMTVDPVAGTVTLVPR